MAAPLRVLYVDDEPALLDIGRIYLERNGFCKVTVADSGAAALELMNETSFDAVISDYQMPKMDGLELLTTVRKKFGNIPFIIFTGRGREEIFVKAVEEGVDFYVQKGGDPAVQFAELIHKVMYAVSGRKARKFIESEDETYRILLEELNEPAFILGKNPDSPLISNRSFISFLDLNDKGIAEILPSEIGIDDSMHMEMFVASLRVNNCNYIDSGLLSSKLGNISVRLWARRILFRGDMALFIKVEDLYNERNKKIPDNKRDESEISQIIENASSIIIKWTPGGILTYFNSFAEKFFGYDKSEVIGKNIVGTIVAEKDRNGKDLAGMISGIARDPGSFTNNENENITKDGRRVWISWTNSGIFDESGNLSGIVSVGNEFKGRLT